AGLLRGWVGAGSGVATIRTGVAADSLPDRSGVPRSAPRTIAGHRAVHHRGSISGESHTPDADAPACSAGAVSTSVSIPALVLRSLGQGARDASASVDPARQLHPCAIHEAGKLGMHVALELRRLVRGRQMDRRIEGGTEIPARQVGWVDLRDGEIALGEGPHLALPEEPQQLEAYAGEVEERIAAHGILP